MGRHWQLDDIAWDKFDPSKVDPEVVPAVKAASLVEANSADYVTYLLNIFADAQDMHAAIRQWGQEEELHGHALAAWAHRVDPSFDFAQSLRRFREGYQLPLDATQSVRGSHAGEMLSRCVVECGTSSFYSAIRDSSEEPLLKDICHRIAGDEFRHYKLFLDNLARFDAGKRMSRLSKLKIALGRVSETDDDELSFAFHCANHAPDAPYDRQACMRDYAKRAYKLYRYDHLARAISMIMKAVGLDPKGRLTLLAQKGVWWIFEKRTRRLQKLAA